MTLPRWARILVTLDARIAWRDPGGEHDRVVAAPSSSSADTLAEREPHAVVSIAAEIAQRLVELFLPGCAWPC